MIATTITCEHGGNDIPPEYRELFRGKEGLLKTHRGYDRGAIDVARIFSTACNARLFSWTNTRLVVDMNRLSDSDTLFTVLRDTLSHDEKMKIIAEYHSPYWNGVKSYLADEIARSGLVAHVAVHSFTPVLKGVVRETDIGLLYDPRRSIETDFCNLWKKNMVKLNGKLRVRKNYPFKGYNDGLTTGMRKNFNNNEYIGIELEINQKFLRKENLKKQTLIHSIISSFRTTCEKF